jgi:hypothetical protein
MPPRYRRNLHRRNPLLDPVSLYLHYYSSQWPSDDHRVRPNVLVVFDDDIAASHFLRVATQEIAEVTVRGN